MKQKRLIPQWVEFDSSEQYGDYCIASYDFPKTEGQIATKESAERFIPEGFRNKIKYWAYEGYIILLEHKKHIIVSHIEYESLKEKGIEGERVIVFCWKYTPKGVGWRKYKALKDVDTQRTSPA